MYDKVLIQPLFLTRLKKKALVGVVQKGGSFLPARIVFVDPRISW